MKPNFLILALGMMFLLPASIYSQGESSQKVFKVYMNGLFEKQTRTLNDFPSDSTIYSLEFRDTDIGYFSPALGFIKQNGDIHEFEISRISIGTSRVDSLVILENPDLQTFTMKGDQVYTIHLAFRYEYMINLRKSDEEAALKPYIGFSAQPYFRYLGFRSYVSSVFPYSYIDVGAVMSIIPRVTYDVNERWFLDLNLPLAVYRINWLQDSFEEPSIPVEDRVQSSFNTESFPNLFQVRFGAGMKF